MGSQKVRHESVTELTDRYTYIFVQINIVRKSSMTLFATANLFILVLMDTRVAAW